MYFSGKKKTTKNDTDDSDSMVFFITSSPRYIQSNYV